MKKASEYRDHAAQCRKIAATMTVADQREQLLRMAQQWEALAEQREEYVRRYGDVPADEPKTFGSKSEAVDQG